MSPNQQNELLSAILKDENHSYYRDHHKVKVAVTDLNGILRGKYISLSKLKSALKKGFGFCNVIFAWDSNDNSYDSQYTGWHTGFPDAKVKLDEHTLRRIPWDKNLLFLLGDFSHEEKEKSLAICPRTLLKKTLTQIQSLGFESLAGMEFEWFNFKESAESLKQKSFQNIDPISPGMFGYSLIRAGQNKEYFNDLTELLNGFSIPLEGIHTETGPGVYEAAIQCSSPIEAADRGVLFKTAVKEIAHKHEIMPTFMARWNEKLPGSSGHVHVSLTDASGRNQFFDEKDPLQMSEVMKSFLAGLIACAGDFLVLMAPTVNSYKRLVPGYWAPTSSTWGIDNRTCAFRVINESPESMRIEVRIPGADVNPYLALAAIYGAGFYGLKNNLPLKNVPVLGNGYEDGVAERFPDNLLGATRAFSESGVAHEIFGSQFVDHLEKAKKWEWQQFAAGVSDWELKRYLEII